jgi:carboxypeptidase A
LIEANIHAREWITSATTTWIINELLTSTDPEVVDYANNINWYIIPIVNPDGLTYTKTTNRNWRKTRTPVNSLCYGVDGNRNFGYNWLTPDETGSLGASTSPCTDLYGNLHNAINHSKYFNLNHFLSAGPSPLSEPEVQAVDLAMARFNSSVDVFLSVCKFN